MSCIDRTGGTEMELSYEMPEPEINHSCASFAIVSIALPLFNDLVFLSMSD